MTIQLRTPAAGKSKAILQTELNQAPINILFEDPSIFAPRMFRGSQIKPGESFPVVMDPATRQRFASVTRKSDGTFKVS